MNVGGGSVQLPRLGFGCSAFWANPLFPEAAAIELVHEALRLGVTYLDTGASYQNGEAERRLARALKPIPRNAYILSTKAGTRVANGGRLYKDFSADWVADSLDRSLERLEVEYVDILFLHGPASSDLSPALIDKLQLLKASGKCRAIGVNSFEPPVLEAVLGLPFDGVMLQYNVIDQRVAALIQDFRRSGRFVVAGTALAQGLYSFRTVNPLRASGLWYLLRALRNNPRLVLDARRLSFLHSIEGMTAGQAALRFVLDHPGVDCALFGTTRVAHLRENAETPMLALPDEVKRRIESLA